VNWSFGSFQGAAAAWGAAFRNHRVAAGGRLRPLIRSSIFLFRSLDRLIKWAGRRSKRSDIHGFLAISHGLEPTSGLSLRDGVLLRADVRNVDAADREDIARKVVIRWRPVFVNSFHPGQVGAAQLCEMDPGPCLDGVGFEVFGQPAHGFDIAPDGGLSQQGNHRGTGPEAVSQIKQAGGIFRRCKG